MKMRGQDHLKLNAEGYIREPFSLKTARGFLRAMLSTYVKDCQSIRLQSK